MLIRKHFRSLPLLLLFTGLLLPARRLNAQIDQGYIHGTVTDASGAVIPNAKATVANEDTGLTLQTSTSGDGLYTFGPIKIGNYTVSVEKEGFQKVAHSHITVNVSGQAQVNFTLNPGAVSQTVEITSQLPLLQTQTSNVGQDLTSHQVNSLPLNGRNYTFLAQVTAGVTQMQSGRTTGTGEFTANGLPPAHNSYLLDGIDNNNDTMDYLNGNAFVVLTPPDAIQEIAVQTSNFSAEFGRAGSAVLQATTKSGTNKFSGDAWEYLRNDALDSATWDANRAGTSKPELRQNQFGFTFGGPIKKNKTFFFGDYQGTRIAQKSLHNPTVPTVAERNSGFTNLQDLILNQSGTRTDALGRVFRNGTVLDPATTRSLIYGTPDPVTGLSTANTGCTAGSPCYVRDPFFNGQSLAGATNFTNAAALANLNLIPAGRLGPNAVKLLNAYPLPNTAGFQGGLSSNRVDLLPQPNNVNQFDVRVDQIFSDKDQMFARVDYAQRHQIAPGDFSGPINNIGFGQGDFNDRAVNAALSETHLFSPTLINEVRVGYSLLTDKIIAASAVNGENPYPAQFGIQGVPSGLGLAGLPEIDISGLTHVGPGAFAAPNTRTSDTRQLTENLTKVRGAHTFKGGFEGQWIHYSYDNPRSALGQMSFSPGFTGLPGNSGLGAGIASLLLSPVPSTVPNGINYDGGAASISATSNLSPRIVRHYYGLYFQDDWKVSSKLTLNLGVRWEYFSLPWNQYGDEANFEPSVNQSSAVYAINSRAQNTPLSPSFTSVLAKDNIAVKYVNRNGLIPVQNNNFAPRIGFAYQPTSKWVLRGSYGIFYAGFENLGSVDMSNNYPWSVGIFLNDSTSATLPLSRQQPSSFPTGAISNLETGLLAVAPNPVSPSFNAQGIGVKGFATPWKTGYTQEWNFTAQYALTNNDMVQAGYVGNHSLHMMNLNQSNQPGVIVPPRVNYRPYVPFRDIATYNDFPATNGDAYYHGLQLTYQRRFANGVSALANYTYSTCMLDYRTILSEDLPNNTSGLGNGLYLPGWGMKHNYQLCNDNAPNVFHLSGTYQVPFGRGLRYGHDTRPAVDAFLGGWSVNGILTTQNGFPDTVPCNIATTSNFQCIANVVKGQSLYINSGPHGIGQFLNPKAFAAPGPATAVGQSDYSPLGGQAQQFHGPSFNNLDFSLFKNFPVHERVYLQFRAEAFNMLNHPNFGNNYVTLDWTNSNFGQINRSLGDNRQIQLALKLYW